MSRLSEKDKSNINKVSYMSEYKPILEFGINLRLYFDITNKLNPIISENASKLIDTSMISCCRTTDIDKNVAPLTYNIFNFKDYDILYKKMKPILKNFDKFIIDNQDIEYHKVYEIEDKNQIKELIECFDGFESPFGCVRWNNKPPTVSSKSTYEKEINNVLTAKANLYRLYRFFSHIHRYSHINVECYFYVKLTH